MKQINKPLIHIFIATVAMFGLTACSEKIPTNYAYKLLFMEQEKFVEPYPTRVIITPEFIRFDDGENSKDFVIFDRLKHIVHSVVADEHTVMSVHNKKTDIESPLKLELTEEYLGEMKDAPAIHNEKPHHYQLLVNGEVCNDVIAVKSLLPAAVLALRDFSVLMASDSKMTLSSMPADMLNACDLAQDSFEPERMFKFGFPVQTMGRRDYARTLVDFDANYKVDKQLFELPADFNRYTVQELREGKVKFAD